MNAEFLQGLGLGEEIIDRIMAEYENDMTALRRELEERISAGEREMEEMRTDFAIERELTGLGAKNLKAARALLDMDALRASEDSRAELIRQLEEIRRDNGYLFRDGRPFVAAGPTARAERGFGFKFTGVR